VATGIANVSGIEAISSWGFIVWLELPQHRANQWTTSIGETVN
jgi:hypothetical protein